jgi:PAS domain S-box-containing protein
MTASNTDSFISTLRQGQVKFSTGKTRPLGRPNAEEAQLALHELAAHQFELEQQNAELRRTVAELKASQARYADLFDQAPAGYVTLSEQGLITEVNLLAADLLGAGKSALVKQPWTRFILPDDMVVYYLNRKKLVETRARQTFDLRLLRPDGTSFWAQVEATVVPDVYGALVYRTVISDITARVRAEQELRRAEAALRTSEVHYRALADETARLLAKTREAAEGEALRLREVNHRVKNNLAALISLLRLDLSYTEAGEQTPYRSLVEDLTSRIQSLALVNNLLTASQGASLELARLAETVMQIAPVLLSRRQPVKLEISPTAVLLSPKQASALGLILNELATNSLKHGLCPDEPAHLCLQTRLDGNEVDLEYRDNGRGYRETTLQGKRESVGLFIIEALAEHDLEGKIAFSDDHGAVARLRFPVDAAAQSMALEAPLFETQP